MHFASVLFYNSHIASHEDREAFLLLIPGNLLDDSKEKTNVKNNLRQNYFHQFQVF